jgi:G:T-mismatch repair DNA endonuclease (very short patch repair protein)
MADLYQRTIDKRKYLEENGYKYICMWECEFDRQCKESRQLQNYIESLEIVPPLEPRDAFYEGHTEV